MSERSRRVAVTGATGFIGRHLTAHLVSQGADVRAIVRARSAHAAPPGATTVQAPLETSALTEAFAGVDAVVHLAGIVSTVREREYIDVNVRGTQAVAAAARAAGARLIYVSSLAAAGPASPAAPRREEDPSAPLTPYGHSKLAGERLITAIEGLRWTILRPSVVYGPGDRAMLPLFRFARLGILPLVGRRDAAYTFIYVHDVVRAIDAALAAPTLQDTVFVGHPHPVTARDLLTRIQAALGGSALTIPIPSVITDLAAMAGEAAGKLIGRPMLLNRWRNVEISAEGFVCHVDRLRDRLGIVAEVDLQRGLNETARWYRQQGWL
ncbi:MAG: NAD-dependent epimerase/dehydratase family protein [Vicinamibacterales bacterium]